MGPILKHVQRYATTSYNHIQHLEVYVQNNSLIDRYLIQAKHIPLQRETMTNIIFQRRLKERS